MTEIPPLSFANYTLSPHTFVQAEQCPRARVFRGPKQATTHAQWHGISLHLFLQYGLERGRDYALGYIKRKFPRALDFMESVPLDQFPEGIVEPQFILDTAARTSELVEKSQVRALSNPREHVIVRGDLLAEDSGVPWVIDFKSGTENKTEPSTSLQSMLEAVTAYTHMPTKPRLVKASVFNVVRPKAKAPVEVIQRTHVFSSLELEAVLDRVRKVHLTVLETRAEYREEGIEPVPAPGEWCRYCQAADGCDARKDTKDAASSRSV